MEIVYPDASKNIREMLSDELINRLNQVANFVVYDGRPNSIEEYVERIKHADAIMIDWGIDNEVLKKCNRLKAISFNGYGVKNYLDLEYLKKMNITVMNTPGYGDNAVAEHALSLLLALTKNIVQNNKLVKSGGWEQESQNIEIYGKTIGLIGFGGIGRKMAKLCSALGMNVICWTFHPNDQRSKEFGVKFVELDELLTISDFVSVHLPYTDQTKGLLGNKELSKMKKGSLFINTARSEIVDSKALLDNLKQGTIAGAGLDVFDEEPLSVKDPLLKLNNVILSPHVGYNTKDAIKKMVEMSANNLISYFIGNLRNVVEK